MHRSRVRQISVQAAAWTVSAALVAALARRLWVPGTLAKAVAAALTLVAGAGVAFVLARGRNGRWRVPATGDRVARVALGPVLVAVLASGALGSPALATLGLAVLWVVRRRPPAAAAVAAAVTLAAVAALGAVTGSPASVPTLVGGAALLAAVVVVPRVLGYTSAARLARERQRAERMGGLLAERDVTPARLSAVTGAGTSPIARAAIAGDGRPHADALSRYLRDVRDWAGAQEAVFWRHDATRGELRAVAWSTIGAAEPQFMQDEWRPLVRWSTEERLVHVDRDGHDGARLAVCPIEWGIKSIGALSVAGAAGMPQPREEIQLWLPRFAAQLAVLSDLLEAQESVARESRQNQTLIAATRDFPRVKTLEELWGLLFKSALTITSAQRAALVRWYAEEGRGSLELVSEGYRLDVGVPITERSYIGVVCAGGRPYIWDDAHDLQADGQIYGEGEPRRPIASLGIVPFHDERGIVCGALVVEGDFPGDVRPADRRALRQLVDLAAASRIRIGELDDQRRRANTDLFTGLWNRGHFDDQLVQEMAKVDRFGGSVGLIVADIDHFKRVNDSYGHEVGDAVLRVIATTIRERVRDVDLCARYGGEEIVVLLPHTGLAGTVETAERLRRAVESRPVSTGGQVVAVTMSFGVASYPESETARESFFAAADRALYRAKAEGRNCVRPATPRDVRPKA